MVVAISNSVLRRRAFLARHTFSNNLRAANIKGTASLGLCRRYTPLPSCHPSSRHANSWRCCKRRLLVHPNVRGASIGSLTMCMADGPWRSRTFCSDTTAVGGLPMDAMSSAQIAGTSNAESARARMRRFMRKAARALRVFWRAVHLVFNMSPLALLYPVKCLLVRSQGDVDGNDNMLLGWWLRLCLWCVERNGAATIKLMQWASSRPDLFGTSFCEIFGCLQDNATPHSWKHTKHLMASAYGENWENNIQLEKMIGSGCIGQVYKGVAKVGNGVDQCVAVKVMHPNIRDTIDADLDVLRVIVRIVEGYLPFKFGANLRWLNLPGVVEEFATMLQFQLDFQTEADNLKRFNTNFKGDPDVIFPHLITEYEPRKDVLVEAFCDGIPIKEFVEANADNADLMRHMSVVAARTVCEMIFEHNFIHGDLHPGNVFVSLKDHKFILLDAGMVTQYTNEDHELIVDILSNFIWHNGRRAAELLIADSNRRMRDSKEYAMNEELYIQKIIHLTDRATDLNLFENLGDYISYICEAASTHHIMMNQAFASMALAVKVQEGIALMLDPKVKVWTVANPIILRSEVKRRYRRYVNRAWNVVKNLANKTIPDDERKL